QFGQGQNAGGNPIPVPAYYLGNNQIQRAVFQPSTSTFYIQGMGAFQFGQGQNAGGNPIPVPGDYLGTGKPQLAVFQPSTSTFFIRGMDSFQFGQGRNAGGNPIPLPWNTAYTIKSSGLSIRSLDSGFGADPGGGILATPNALFADTTQAPIPT